MVSSGGPLGSSRLRSLGIVNSVLRPGSPYCKVDDYSENFNRTSKSYDLTFDRTSIDGKVSKVSQELLGPILALHELKEVWGIINKLKEIIRAGLSEKNSETILLSRSFLQ